MRVRREMDTGIKGPLVVCQTPGGSMHENFSFGGPGHPLSWRCNSLTLAKREPGPFHKHAHTTLHLNRPSSERDTESTRHVPGVGHPEGSERAGMIPSREAYLPAPPPTPTYGGPTTALDGCAQQQAGTHRTRGVILLPVLFVYLFYF